MSDKWTLKYSSAAVITAILIIALSLIVNPPLLQPTSYPKASLAIMLTDPPTVPDGTSVLNLTYSDILLHVTYPNKTTDWFPVTASGTVNLLSLVNMTQTLAYTSISINSTIDKIQFNIAEVNAVVNGTLYEVTPLSESLILNVADGYINQTLSGVLLDFNPTLVQTQATSTNGTLIDRYVLVPSATAVVVSDLSNIQLDVGTVTTLKEEQKTQLKNAQEEFKKNVETVIGSLSIQDDTTVLTLTLENEGPKDLRIFGITLHGEFKTTQTRKMQSEKTSRSSIKIHPRTIPFKLHGTSLVPLLGTAAEQKDEEPQETPAFSSFILQPEESITLTFTGTLFQSRNENAQQATIITPIAGNTYVLRLMGEGSQTLEIEATS